MSINVLRWLSREKHSMSIKMNIKIAQQEIIFFLKKKKVGTRVERHHKHACG